MLAPFVWRGAPPTVRRPESDPALMGATKRQLLERELRALQQERPRDHVAEAMVRAKLSRTR